MTPTENRFFKPMTMITPPKPRNSKFDKLSRLALKTFDLLNKYLKKDPPPEVREVFEKIYLNLRQGYALAMNASGVQDMQQRRQLYKEGAIELFTGSNIPLPEDVDDDYVKRVKQIQFNLHIMAMGMLKDGGHKLLMRRLRRSGNIITRKVPL